MIELLCALLCAALLSHLALGPCSRAPRRARLAALGPAVALILALGTPLAWLLDRLLATGIPDLLRPYLLMTVLLPLGWALPALLQRLRRQPARDLWPLPQAAVLGAALLGPLSPTFMHGLLVGLGSATAYWLLLQLTEGLRRRLEERPGPVALRGAPLLIIASGLAGLALLGLEGLGPL